jgi:Flp pilus assembly protein protease CpaA
MTFYLLADPVIRSRLRSRPITLIVVPALFFPLCILVNAAPFPNGNWAFVPFMFFLLAWQSWHFGKQNVGVCSFICIAQNRIGGMPPVERRLLMFGAALGVVGSYLISVTQIDRVPQIDYDFLRSMKGIVWHVGFFGQIILLGYSIYYVLRTRITITNSIALLLSVNFFLPLYFQGPDVEQAYSWTSFAHGVQYMVFLLFHAMNYSGKTSLKLAALKVQVQQFSKVKMTSVFIITSLLMGDIYLFNIVVPTNYFSGFLAGVSGFSSGNVGSGIALGVLLTHFWIDSFLWRFKGDPAARNWMIVRYDFLFDKSNRKSP